MTSPPLAAAVVQGAEGPRLVVLTLQSDRVTEDGRTLPIESPPVQEIEVAGWRPCDDLAPAKPASDLVIAAIAHAPRGRAVDRMEVAVELPAREHAVVLRVVGDRRCSVRGDRLEFAAPEPFVSMPLGWNRAYGGTDPEAELDHDADLLLLARVAARRVGWGAYPRNPLGRGWRVGGELARFDGIVLPNLEDPHRSLRPDDLPVASVRAWARQPIPRGLGSMIPDGSRGVPTPARSRMSMTCARSPSSRSGRCSRSAAPTASNARRARPRRACCGAAPRRASQFQHSAAER